MLADKISWDEIKNLYEKARFCLWCPKHVSQWSRDESNGMFYLWSAYHYATASDGDGIDHQTYARILEMMAHELRYKISDYERFHKYVVPSVQEYEQAIAAGQKIGDKEYAIICDERDALDYQLKHESGDDWDEIIGLIENGELLNKTNFGFHDSKPVYFEQISDQQAVLKLNYNHLLAIFRFKNVESIDIHTDPVTNWVGDAYCYRLQNSKFIVFNAGDYTFTSETVRVPERRKVMQQHIFIKGRKVRRQSYALQLQQIIQAIDRP